VRAGGGSAWRLRSCEADATRQRRSSGVTPRSSDSRAPGGAWEASGGTGAAGRGDSRDGQDAFPPDRPGEGPRGGQRPLPRERLSGSGRSALGAPEPLRGVLRLAGSAAATGERPQPDNALSTAAERPAGFARVRDRAGLLGDPRRQGESPGSISFRRRSPKGAAEIVVRLARLSGPLFICIDDLQWIDPLEPRGPGGDRRPGPRGAAAARAGGSPGEDSRRHLRTLRCRGTEANSSRIQPRPVSSCGRAPLSSGPTSGWRRPSLPSSGGSLRPRTTRPSGFSRCWERFSTPARCACGAMSGSSIRRASSGLRSPPAPSPTSGPACASFPVRPGVCSRSRPSLARDSTTPCLLMCWNSTSGMSATPLPMEGALACSRPPRAAATRSVTTVCGRF
jgi:hypothetical protein